MWQRLKRPTAERREAPWTGPTRFDEVQTKENSTCKRRPLQASFERKRSPFPSFFAMADVGEERTVEATDGH